MTMTEQGGSTARTRGLPTLVPIIAALAALAALAAVSLRPQVLVAMTSSPGGAPVLVDTGLWADWRNRFLLPDGRVVDTGNGGISHSEGQGYGMLLAAFAGDRQSFDAMWAWTRTHLGVRPDGLFAWRFRPGNRPPVDDPNNATDGDLLIAWALVEAHRRWPESTYRAQAATLARAIASHATLETPAGRMLMPGVIGFSATDRPDGPVVNLSYYVFPAFEALATVTPEIDWSQVVRHGLALVAHARFGPADLPSDWVSLAGAVPRPAEGFTPEFGYNAIRIPLYLAWSGFGRREDLAVYASLWRGDPIVTPAIVDVGSGRWTGAFGQSGYGAIPAIVACALEGRRIHHSLRRATDEPYYPATLRLLTLAAVAGRYPTCL